MSNYKKAAHDLHVKVDQWSTKDNDILAVAKRITVLMAELNDLVKNPASNKKNLIETAKKLSNESQEITRLAKILAAECTDKRMRNVRFNFYTTSIHFKLLFALIEFASSLREDSNYWNSA